MPSQSSSPSTNSPDGSRISIGLVAGSSFPWSLYGQQAVSTTPGRLPKVHREVPESTSNPQPLMLAGSSRWLTTRTWTPSGWA